MRVLHQLSFVPQRPAHESRDFDLVRSPGREISRDRYEIASLIKIVIGADSVLWSARALSTAKEIVLNASDGRILCASVRGAWSPTSWFLHYEWLVERSSSKLMQSRPISRRQGKVTHEFGLC